MDNSFLTSVRKTTDRCEVCNSAIDFAGALRNRNLEYVVCGDVECRKLLLQKAEMPPALYKTHFPFQKNRIIDRKQREADKNRHKSEVVRQENSENAELVSLYMESYGNQDLEKLDFLMIPTGLSHEIMLEPERIEKYKHHIKTIVADAVDAKNMSGVVIDQHATAREHLLALEVELGDKPRLRKASDKICTLCGGGCCSVGGEHGFLSAATIRRLLDKDNQLTPQKIVERYIDLIPEKSIENSCVNQTSIGCSLPRELRSDVCNSFYCDELRQFQKRQAADVSNVNLLVVQRSNTNWNRFSTETKNDVTRVVAVNEYSEKEIHLAEK